MAKTLKNEQDRRRVAAELDAELCERFDAFRRSHRIMPGVSDAVRFLMKRGLDAEQQESTDG